MSRKTITVREAAYDRLAAEKPDDVSWSTFLSQLIQADDVGDTEHTPNTLTEEHIDDIALQTAERVENRLSRR